MSDLTTKYMAGIDGAKLAVHEMGPAVADNKPPVLLLHGLFSNADVNWIKFGHASRLAAAGYQTIMPDFRAHGASAHPHDPAAYPDDVLVQDLKTIIADLNLAPGSYHLAGFSLGARTSARAVAAGIAAPRSLALLGMGLEGLAGWARRSAFFIDAIDRYDDIKTDDPAFFAKSFMKTQGTDRIAARLLLNSLQDMDIADLSKITTPSCVICGTEDRDNGDPEALARALPNAHLTWIPGTHMSSVTHKELGDALVAFLSQHAGN